MIFLDMMMKLGKVYKIFQSDFTTDRVVNVQLIIQEGSMLRPVGSPMQLDLVCWQLTFHGWFASLATAISSFYFIYLFIYSLFSFPKIHDKMNEC